MEHAIYLTRQEAIDCGSEDQNAADVIILRHLRLKITHTTHELGQVPRIIYPDEDGYLTDLVLPPCKHEHQDVNDRSQFICDDCGEELGR